MSVIPSSAITGQSDHCGVPGWPSHPSEAEFQKWMGEISQKPIVPPVPTITITLAEFTLLNRRIGYLEGVWEAVSVDDVPGGVVDQVNARYKEICGGKTE